MNEEKEIMKMLEDTTTLVAKHQSNNLSNAMSGAANANTLANNVEFWQWLDRNYSGANGHMFQSNQSIQHYINQGAGKENWVKLQLQGKGYEWDYMTLQRNRLSKVFSKYFAGDSPTQPGIDITETSLIDSKVLGTYQNKAYISKTKPDIHNTPKDAIVVTNREKVEYVQNKGYTTEQYMNKKQIEHRRDKRLNQAKKGDAYTTYNFKNVGLTMAKAGFIGCVIGITSEAVSSYHLWEDKQITDDEYVERILLAGGDAGVTAGTTAGIMVPVSAAITAAGMSNIITIPIAIAVSAGINKIVAPCFKRGDYAKYLEKAKYYANIEGCFGDFMNSVEYAAEQYEGYLRGIQEQNREYEALKSVDRQVDKTLKNLYDSI